LCVLRNFLARATKTKSKRAKYLEAVPQYFVKVEELAMNHPSSRVRYMLKDLIDLRWASIVMTVVLIVDIISVCVRTA
jgi:hypothetical protein